MNMDDVGLLDFFSLSPAFLILTKVRVRIRVVFIRFDVQSWIVGGRVSALCNWPEWKGHTKEPRMESLPNTCFVHGTTKTVLRFFIIKCLWDGLWNQDHGRLRQVNHSTTSIYYERCQKQQWGVCYLYSHQYRYSFFFSR